ncbi:MAG: chemotaxis response regulator protein-glutamate methylesterase [Ketobacteraceae bacterium]|nr:chemotaxis response regulator protein-glutamate methylesterase [Ketobacteraceae bacterium]
MINVFIIDDSALMRTALSELLADVSDIAVIGTAQDPIFAKAKMARNWPDVIILDLEMPRMDGLTFLSQLMTARPTPVIVCSAYSEKGSDKAMESLKLGAIDVMGKPKIGVREFIVHEKAVFVDKIRAAARARIQNQSGSGASGIKSAPKAAAETSRVLPRSESGKTKHQHAVELIGIGASTGGTQALEKVLLDLPATTPGIVIVQHMPEKFTRAFADRLNARAMLHISEAEHGEQIVPGRAFIAPGGKHTSVVRRNDGLFIRISDDAPVNRHKPSVDVLFNSIAHCVPRHSAAFLLTGMGNDGAAGLKAIRDTGALTAAQDEETSVVFGMPNEAIKLDAADYVLPLEVVSAFIQSMLRPRGHFHVRTA